MIVKHVFGDFLFRNASVQLFALGLIAAVKIGLSAHITYVRAAYIAAFDGALHSLEIHAHRGVSKIIAAVYSGHAGAVHQIRVARRVDEIIGGEILPARLTVRYYALHMAAVCHNAAQKGVEIYVRPRFLQHIRQRQRKHCGRISAVQSAVFLRIVIAPTFLGGGPADLPRHFEHFVRHAVNYLFAAAVAHGHEIIYKSVCRQSAERKRFFRYQRLFARTRSAYRRRDAGHSAAYDYNVPFARKRHVFGYSHFSLLVIEKIFYFIVGPVSLCAVAVF